MEFSELVTVRRSIRAFKPTPISEDDLDKILMAVRAAPTAGNLQSFKMVVTRDPGIRKQLAVAAWGQNFVAQAPVVICFTADITRAGTHYGTRGRELYAIQDATIACTYAMLAATDVGLGSVWVGAFDSRKAARILNCLPDEEPVAILALGHPAEHPKATPRRELSEIVRRL